jgi:hypothetical protein
LRVEGPVLSEQSVGRRPGDCESKGVGHSALREAGRTFELAE